MAAGAGAVLSGSVLPPEGRVTPASAACDIVDRKGARPVIDRLGPGRDFIHSAS
jgi:hypothetical protein